MAPSVDRWTRETGYVSESSGSSSSDESIIPHGRPRNSFTSYNSTAQRNNTLIRASPASPGDGNHSDADVEIIKSDLPQPVPQDSVTKDANLHVSSATPPTGPPVNHVEGKRTMSASARERQSQIMKERWAAGRMSHVPEKIRQAKKRKAAMQGFSDDDDEPPPKKISSTVDRSTLESHARSASQHEHTSGYSRSQLQLWEYIRPHLEVFKDKPIPNRYWVPNLLSLPRVRDLKFNPRRAGKHPYLDTDEKKLAALILQLTGKPALQPCSRCLNGNGVFAECVKLSANAPLGANIRNCASCWYSHQACVHESAPEDNDKAAPEDDHRTAPQDDDDHIVVDDDSAQSVHSDGKVSSEISKALNKNAPQLEPRSMPAIRTTLSGRRYNKWPDESGEMAIKESNVLLPDEYKLNTDSQKPWWCPVDECRRLFPTLKALGCHFPRVHYAQMLNDNLDGTFSILGLYDDPRLGNGGSYPKEPPSFPYVASRKAKFANDTVFKPGIPRQSVTNPLPVQSYDIEEEDEADQPSRPDTSKSMWQYIKPHLKKTMAIPDKGWVKELLPMPRVRDLQWNPARRSDFNESHARDISCMIIQVTGEEAPKPCTKCAEGRGPFSGCVVISRDAPPEVRARMVSCANCNYHNRQIDCSLIDWVIKREQPAWPGYLGKGGQPVLRPSESTPTASLSTLETPGGVSTRRESERLPSGDPKPASSHSASTTTPHAPAQTSGPAGDRNVIEISRPRPPPRREPSAVIPLGQPNPEEILEMEDWEIAPGRIRFQASETQDDVALSRAYLTSNKSTQVHSDLAVRIDVINTGSTLRFEPMDGKIRSCVVHSGKLRVKMDGEPEFTIGPLGQFKIPAAVACSAQNRLYIDSVLIVNTLTVYD